nr:hypothetical protein [Tanacetum cinerariifolium]
GSKTEESAPKALMAIDGVGWDWSYTANDEKDHALVADQEASTEFALMAKFSSDKEVFDNSLCSKACKKNTDSLNTKITELSEKLSDTKTTLYHYKLGLSQVKTRLVEFKNQEIKFCEKIRGLEFKVESKDNRFERLTNELEELKNEKEGLDSKLTCFQSASKDLDTLLGSQRSDKNKEGLGYSTVPPPAQVYSPSKKDMSWTRLPKFADDTITDYSRPSPSTESNSSDFFVSKNGESSKSILSKPMIKFVKATDSPTVFKTNKVETTRKPSVKYAEMYRDTHKSPKVRECIVLGRDFKLRDDTNVFLRTPRQHNKYFIDLNNIVPHKDLTCLVAKASADESVLWHRRLGHLNFKTMNKLVRHNIVRGLPSKCFDNDHTCVACLKGKQHKASYKTKLVHSVTKPLHTLHMDLFGPTFVSSLNHKWYCLVVTDDFSSNARTPQQNGVAERRNRTLIEAARTMLADAKLPVTFWAEAVNTACYVQNRVLVNKSQNRTPYELFNGRTPAIGFLKPFGCHVMILNTLDHLWKFDVKGDKGYFIGYSMSSKAFRVFNKRTKRVEENLHVDFLENKLIEKGAGLNWLFDIDTLTNSMNYVSVVDAGTSSTNFLGTKDAASQDVKKDVSSLRYIAFPNWFHEAHLKSSTSNAQDACKADAPESSGNSNPTATSTNPLADQMETVLKNKKDERGIVIKNKARLVAQGHTQEEGIDYEEVFAPVAMIKAISLFLAYASFMGFTVYQMDVKSAFLYGTIGEEVYVMQPPGFQDPEFPARVYKVEKAMYGLHQAPRAWVIVRRNLLGIEADFYEEAFHWCRRLKLSSFQQSGWLVKDLDNYHLKELHYCAQCLTQCRKIPRLVIILEGEMCTSGKIVTNSRETPSWREIVSLTVLVKLASFMSANTPMDKENPWEKDRTGKDVDLYLYRSMIGSLMYLTASRPDIMFAVCAYARHQVTPKECHLHAVKRIFRYLKSHPKLGIWYPKGSLFDLVAYSDSDYGGATQDRKSTTEGC